MLPVRVCVVVWCSCLCSPLSIENWGRGQSPPRTVSHVFLLLLYLWVVTSSQMCMSEYMWWKKKKKKRNCHSLKTATVNRVVYDQVPQVVVHMTSIAICSMVQF